MSPKLKEAIENLYSLFEEGEVMNIVFLAVNDENNHVWQSVQTIPDKEGYAQLGNLVSLLITALEESDKEKRAHEGGGLFIDAVFNAVLNFLRYHPHLIRNFANALHSVVEELAEKEQKNPTSEIPFMMPVDNSQLN